MKLASCCSCTRNVIDVMKAMVIMTTVILLWIMVVMTMIMVMWGMLLTVKVLLILVATVVTSFTEDTVITTQVQICDLGGVKVKVICLNLCSTGIFSPASITPAVIC
jgi:hypothetical protein